MPRLLVALLAALDAAVAAGVGIAAALAPLTLMWVFTLGGVADWPALWPASARIWQLGNLVPLTIELDPTLLAELALPEEAGSFAVSIAPLAFAVGVALFAVRSGRRAQRAGRWFTGVASGTLVTLGAAALVNVTAGNPVAHADALPALLLPTAVYALPALAGAISAAWSDGDAGIVDRVHDALDRLPAAWREVPSLIVRGGALALVAVVGFAALAVAVSVLLRGGDMIALYQASQVDALGVILVTLAQFAYLPTLIGWTVAWIAGPGFALGTATAVTPAGTQLGVLPGIPVLGLLPEHGSPLLVLWVLGPVLAGALAGWGMRMALRHELGPLGDREEPSVPRAVIALGIGVAAGTGGALLAVLTSGALGPGRFVEAGPEPGAVALALGLEVLLGAAITLLGPRAAETRLQRFLPRRDVDEAEAVAGGDAARDVADADGRGRSAPLD
ncbi:cell division protein PerM [Microbacterium album]|uniref:Uncharacterized protein n=1 Tax=Microbacterium album TaxID=2053191 RepID=A0A917IGV7_9MICO|nr:DUF6350 family protein [Microbacterium album]GGH50797.1 hypothetical protein GCM10010921_29780 [Microbacterium album]